MQLNHKTINILNLKKSKKRVLVSIPECAFGKGYPVLVYLFYKGISWFDFYNKWVL